MRTTRSLLQSKLVAAKLSAFVVATAAPALADNPFVQHMYTADPAPMVYGDRVYVCTSHDEDVTVDNFFTMNDWYIFSSTDMVNWTDHGSPLSYQSFAWASGKAWAPHCVERDGRFYMYVPVSDTIGVAVADNPLGPYEDALGQPLLSNWQYIDPAVYVDDDGQAYLYFGNPQLWYVRLNDDMISIDGGVQEIPMTTQSFGQRNGDPERATLYEEGPWFFKRDGTYYMQYASGPLPETISYSTSPGPTGPWTYQGTIMQNTNGHAFTNHGGMVDFKGRSFFFYHTQELPGGGGFKRSVAVEEFSYGADGSIPEISKTREGPAAVDNLNPYVRNEGETIAWNEGVEVEDCSEGGRNVTSLDDGDYIKVESVEFRTGALSFEASVASGGSGGNIELRLGDQSGSLIGTCAVEGTGGPQSWTTINCPIDGAEGVNDLFLVFTGGGQGMFNLDWWQFTPIDPLPEDPEDDEMGGGGDTDAGAPDPALDVDGPDSGSAGGASGVPDVGMETTGAGGANGAGVGGGASTTTAPVPTSDSSASASGSSTSTPGSTTAPGTTADSSPPSDATSSGGAGVPMGSGSAIPSTSASAPPLTTQHSSGDGGACAVTRNGNPGDTALWALLVSSLLLRRRPTQRASRS